MEKAALVATVDIGRAVEILRTLPVTVGADIETYMRGIRFVRLAHAQQQRLGFRSDNVETWLRWGFRILSRWAIKHNVH